MAAKYTRYDVKVGIYGQDKQLIGGGLFPVAGRTTQEAEKVAVKQAAEHWNIRSPFYVAVVECKPFDTNAKW